MIRRENRLRREYIYRKSLEQRQKAIEEKREKVKDAIENNRYFCNFWRMGKVPKEKKTLKNCISYFSKL